MASESSMIRRTCFVLGYDVRTRLLTMLECNDGTWMSTGDANADIIAVRIDGVSEDADVDVVLCTHRSKYTPVDRFRTIQLRYDPVNGVWAATLSGEDMAAIAGFSTDVQLSLRENRKRELSFNMIPIRLNRAFVL